ncbi:MAG: pyruvate, phosphate dikinase [Bacteroidetes bacterium]|nr:pyruvate, phosphate dikinase [Bacteroidota bacterium]
MHAWEPEKEKNKEVGNFLRKMWKSSSFSVLVQMLFLLSLTVPPMFRKSVYLFLLVVVATTTSFSQRAPDFFHKLESRKEFDMMKGEPLAKNFNGIECVKLVYAVASKKLYYLESKRYRWHHLFTKEVLGDLDDLDQFNQKNYSNTSSRKYILATFNYNVNTKNYFLQFAAADNPSDELINELVEKVKSSFFKQDQFKILLNSTVLLRRKKDLEKNHKIMTSDELFKNQGYQAIYRGKTTGILKFLDADSLKQNKNYSNTILILKGNSNMIPVCKGVVTTEFQTPLSHICLLTASRKTPCAAQKDIFSSNEFRQLENKYVEITVGKEAITVKPADPALIKTKKPVKKLKLKVDTLTTEIADLTTLSYKRKSAYGSKVCNLAELKKIKFQKQSLNTPAAAFGIPFYYYAQHIRKSKIDGLISDFLKDTVVMKSDSLIERQLKRIRQGIKNVPIHPVLLQKVTAMCVERFGNKKVRFRSSSNCEDEANFNGAGLYTSETGIPGDTSRKIEAAIKKVWASLWTMRAFKEREFFHVDHSTVFMAVLVHPAFDNELVNGVAVTKNLYRSYDFGFVINMQKGEEEVVAPKTGTICEQVVSYMNNNYADFYNKNRTADWISFSTLSPGVSLLSAEELMQLTLQLESIKKYYYDLYRLWGKVEYRDFGMDVEFKVIEGPDKKRSFLFKQARPYNN